MAARELRRSGMRVRLDAKAFDLLVVLLENRGELLTRDRLRARLWPATHVDFEHGLNNTINRLRAALGDSAHAPRFIETLPRRGYRFVAPMEVVETTAQPELPHRLHFGLKRAVTAACVALLSALLLTSYIRLPRPQQEAAVLPASCIKGAHLLDSLDFESPPAAHQYLQECVAAAPGYAHGRQSLAISYNRMAAAGLLDPATAYPAAIAEAERALALDSKQVLAYVARGVARLRRDWDWAAAERDHLQAIRVAPAQPEPHHSYALLLAAMRRHDEALRHIAEAQRLAPADTSITADNGMLLYLARRYAHAEAQLRLALEMQPHNTAAQHHLSNVLMEQGRYPAAAHEFVKWLEMVGVDENERNQAGAVIARSGLAGLARRAFKKEKHSNPGGYGKALKLATLHASLGETSVALDLLDRARRERDARLIFVAVDPKFDALRRDPRFGELLKSVGLPL